MPYPIRWLKKHLLVCKSQFFQCVGFVQFNPEVVFSILSLSRKSNVHWSRVIVSTTSEQLASVTFNSHHVGKKSSAEKSSGSLITWKKMEVVTFRGSLILEEWSFWIHEKQLEITIERHPASYDTDQLPVLSGIEIVRQPQSQAVAVEWTAGREPG